MQVVCLDLEGVLIPEIWIAFAERTGADELMVTSQIFEPAARMRSFELVASAQ